MTFYFYNIDVKGEINQDPKTFLELIDAIQEHHKLSISIVKQFFKLDAFFYEGDPTFVGEFAIQDKSNLYIVLIKHYQGNYVRDIVITLSKNHQQITYKSIMSMCKKCSSSELFADISFEGGDGDWRQIKIEYYIPIFQKAKIVETQREIKKTEHWYITDKGFIVKNTKKK
ncbi:hypothetical protein [Xanthocytophaga flava]|uniref:hypothetical protein n=1 Tax=Xanthocytophaga flava TaxID=3048013 RepID=UPI0028D02251|nr:hypothetical protein [Xanthocytophaga flavus]